jgi:anti-sigma factor RsiW
MMSDCRRTVERLSPYVDHLLPPTEHADVERHLAICPPCRSAALAESGARTVLREKAPALKVEPLPPGLRGRCEALAREHTRRTSAFAWTRIVPVSLSAVLVVFTATALFALATQRSDTLLAAQLTADHAKCFKLFAGPESATSDAAYLQRMLLEHYGWDVHVPPSSPADGVQLIGARRCLYADGRVPHVMYRVNGEDVSLFMLEGVVRDAADVTSLGHRSRIWSRDGTTYVLVSPASAGDLTDAARYVMQEAH